MQVFNRIILIWINNLNFFNHEQILLCIISFWINLKKSYKIVFEGKISLNTIFLKNTKK